MTEESATQSEHDETPEAVERHQPGRLRPLRRHRVSRSPPPSAASPTTSCPEDLQPTEDNPLAKPLDPDDEATKSRAELEMDASQEEDDAIAGEGEVGEGAQGDGISQG